MREGVCSYLVRGSLHPSVVSWSFTGGPHSPFISSFWLRPGGREGCPLLPSTGSIPARPGHGVCLTLVFLWELLASADLVCQLPGPAPSLCQPLCTRALGFLCGGAMSAARDMTKTRWVLFIIQKSDVHLASPVGHALVCPYSGGLPWAL